jgi:hypothetical protein
MEDLTLNNNKPRQMKRLYVSTNREDGGHHVRVDNNMELAYNSDYLVKCVSMW